MPPPPVKTQDQPTGIQFQLPSAHGIQLKSVGSPAPPSRAPPSPLMSSNNGAPSPLKSSPMPSPTSSPGVPRRLPPQPNINNNNNNSTSNITSPPTINHLPPPPVNHMPPPPPSSIINKVSPSSSPAPVKRSPPTANGMPPPNNMPPPPPPISSPSYKSPALSGVNHMPPPPQINNMPPPPQFVNSSPSQQSSSSNTCNTSNSINSLNLSGGFPPPPPMVGCGSSPNLSSQPFLKPPAPAMPRSSSLDPKSMSQFLPNPVFKRHSVENKRLSQDLSTMLTNRLQHGLSPPVATPYYDQNILGGTKAQELKDRRDIEEKDRRDRERVKKEKEDQDKKDKKEKKEKEEQDKKDKKKKEEQEKLEKKEKKKKEEAEKKEKKSSALKNSNGMSGSGGIACTTIFANSLPQIMELQREKFPEFNNYTFPAILKILADGILALDGPNTEGIFRITGTTSEVNRLKKQINEHDFSIDSTSDPHVLAGLLKLWLRELVEPVIPSELYYQCIKSRSKDDVSRLISTIPDINKEVINYLMVFLKHVSNPSFAIRSKMDIDNIAMVFAPGLLRCPVVDPNMLLNTQYEKDFIKNLIELS